MTVAAELEELIHLPRITHAVYVEHTTVPSSLLKARV